MFADDTTVYLGTTDSFDKMQKLLQKWGDASSAKFNVGKTEVIPVGSPEYRQKVIDTRGLNDNEQIPENIHVAKDGESVQILGGHVGNNIDNFTMWTPVIKKIDADLVRWEALHLTIETKAQIVQITIRSMTQYLTQVNEMPPQIFTHLERAMRKFIWSGKAAPRSMEML